MRDPMSQMAADVFVEMTRDTPGRIPHPQPEAVASHPHLEVERELLGPPPEPRPLPVSRRTQRWAREHTSEALVVTTVGLGWLMRRGRRRRQHSG
jgi:hypothetical protein